MRHRLSGRAASMALSGLLLAGTAGAQPVTALSDSVPDLDVRTAATEWTDRSGQTTIEQVTDTTRAPVFTPAQVETIHRLGTRAVLWQHYRFSKNAASRQDWVLEFPLPLLDLVTVYQAAPSGGWASQTAGDTVAVTTWPEPGRYGQFGLSLTGNGVHDVYVRIQHVTDVSIPGRVSTRGSQGQRLQMEYLGIGVVFGALLLLIIACAVQSRVYRDKSYAWYALYATVMALVVAAWTGVAGHLLWGNWVGWNNLAQGCLGVLGGASALLMLEHLCGAGAPRKHFGTAMYVAGLAGFPVMVAYGLMDRAEGVRLIGAYLVVVVLMGMSRAWITWRRGDIIGPWVLAAFTPLALVTLAVVASIVGLSPASWLSQYGLMVGLVVEVPLLLVALNLRSRERHDIRMREKAMTSHDALTGLLAQPLFADRLKQVVARSQRSGAPAAVVYIELVNYSYIKKNWGTAVAEQSLLRSVIKLRRLLQDFNSVGRIDEACFGLILEGVDSRVPVTELAARLIAAGLMPLKGLKPEVVLQFHVAGVLLSERAGSDAEISAALGELLRSMAARTRRPIRFLEPELTRPMALDAADLEEPGEPTAPQPAAGTLSVPLHSNR